ncbi:cbb3-type cytochrome c oxidase subunit I [Amorphus sp. 3PC139-8]|uniref:cytochrome c oxidase subunit I n=1 Tax=Amorphus sp. 3PC139-8 TaxID=2735676 RepID=UPI00345D2123
MTELTYAKQEPLHFREDGTQNYLADGRSVWSWLTTLDHKRIALLYMGTLVFFFFIGAVGAALVRLELVTPAGDLLTDEGYNKMFTLHGIIMVWFFLVPAVPSTLGNFVLPLQLGAPDLAFPRLNLFSWYLFSVSGLVALFALIVGGVDTGWTFYAPLSSIYSDSHVILAVVAVFISGFSTIATALNFVVTIHTMRAPGQTWFRLPLFVWSLYATSIIMLLATPVLAVTLVLIAAERLFGVGVFDPRVGGDPLLFQHLFWFYSHPAVYIMILPGMGIVSEVIATAARQPVFGYRAMAFSLVGIAVIGFFVWGHHMFVAGQSMYASIVFSLLSFLVAIPSAIKVFNWLGTLYGGTIRIDTPFLYAAGFVGLFTLGGLTGLFLASLPIDVHVTDTYFVVAHFHYIMVGGMVSALFAGIHYWWPKISGRLFNEQWGRTAAILMFFGFNLTFFPQFIMGYMGMPRRYHVYPEVFQIYHVLSSAGAVVLAFAYLMPLIYLSWSFLCGRAAGPNPWGAIGLEWETTSPPPTRNFNVRPRVVSAPYGTPSSTIGGDDG